MSSYKTIIKKALEKESLSHCYLLTGKGDLLEDGFWLSSVLMSNQLDNDELIDRFKNNESIDFLCLSGESEPIKKEDIIRVQNLFSNTASEIYGHKVLLLHQCHNGSAQTLNALLKMIEEPNKTSFVLTTNQIEQVLPTILSRCLVLHVDDHQESFEEYEWVVEFLAVYKTNLTQGSIILYELASKDLDTLKQGTKTLLDHLKKEVYLPDCDPITIRCYEVFTRLLGELTHHTNVMLAIDRVVYLLLEE